MTESITLVALRDILQQEYDRHMAKYFKGCIGCINSAIAIVHISKILKVEIVECDRTKPENTHAAKMS